MRKQYFFLIALGFSSSSFALENLPLSHKGLEKLKMQEIGPVIKNFLPNSDVSAIWWDYKSNNPSIIWLHRPYTETQFEDGSIQTIRKGVFRSNVLGVQTTYLQDRKYELPWSVIYLGKMAKFGVTEIQFHPNLPDIDIIDSYQCFGASYDNCDFNPIKSLKNVGVNSKMICRDDTGSGSNYKKAYLLTANGKKPTYAIHSMSTGSGGSSNDFSLMHNTTKNEICNLVKD